MKILDRYILKKFLAAFIFTLFLMIAVITLIDITEKSYYYSKHQLSYKALFDYYCAFIPFMANLLTPITVFITTVWVTARLAQRTEIIAILSSGISFMRFAVPYFIGAMLITLSSFALTGWLLAKANKTRVDFETKYIDYQPDHDAGYLHIKIGPDSYLYIERYWPYNYTGTNVTLETIKDNQLIEKLSAKKMKWIAAKAQWRFSAWMSRKINGLEEHISQGNTLDRPLDLHPDDFCINPKLRETLTIPELNAHIKKLQDKGADNIHVFLTEKYIRYMSPFAVLILTFMGLFIAAYKSRSGIGLQISLGFILAFGYIAFFLLAKIMAEAKGTQLLLTIWMPNLIFSGLCLLCYRLVPK